METQLTIEDINKQQLIQIDDFFKNPSNGNIAFALRDEETLNVLKTPLFKSFLIKYPYIDNQFQIYKAFSLEKDIWEILEINEKEIIINILKKNKINNEEQIFKLLNAITVHFITMELLNYKKNEKIIKAFEVFDFIRNAIMIKFKYNIKKIIDKSKPYLNMPLFNSNNKFNITEKEINDLPLEVINLLKHLKLPARKPVSGTINILLYMLVETASDSNIKNHYSDFLIPTLKSFKLIFPNQFREIKHLGKTYLMKRVKNGKNEFQKGDDFILRGGYADSIL